MKMISILIILTHRCLHADHPLNVYQDKAKENNPQDDIEEINEIPNEDYDDDDDDDDNIIQVIPTASRRLSGVHREFRNLTAFYNTNPGETAEIAMSGRYLIRPN
jgi:hypothetical protein